MLETTIFRAVLSATLLLSMRGSALAAGSDEPSPARGLCRYPDISKTDIVFSYANDLWIVPKQGGTARPVANPPGFEGRPRFSPDGKSIAFRANYDGGLDLYTLPIEGGVPHRVTHHPGAEGLSDWTPDGGSLIFVSSDLGGLKRANKLYTVPAGGGLPTQLPVPYGVNGSIDRTGEWLAYTPSSTDNANWKRYRGGMATDVWLFNLKTGESKRITDWEGTDTQPMWHGRSVYYLSDRGDAESYVLNIWRYDLDSGKTERVTRMKTYDVKWPAIGPDDGGAGEMVFQHGDRIYVLDLGSNAARPVDIAVPGDRRTLRVATVEASPLLANSATLSQTGKRVLAVARGDIWSIPAENGTPRNLTRTDGVFERSPALSPDGASIAYFSDATGEYELYTMPVDGKADGVAAPPVQITKPVDGAPSVFRTAIAWAPDSKSVVVQDKAGHVDLVRLEDGSSVRLDTNPDAPVAVDVSFSRDSRWIAWSRSSDTTERSSIYLYDTREADPAKARVQVTSGFYSDSTPVFDRKGEWLVYVSARNFSPTESDFDSTWIYEKSQVLMAVPLKSDYRLPWLATSDEEAVPVSKKSKGAASDAASAPKPADVPSDSKKTQEPGTDAPKVDEPKSEGVKSEGVKKEEPKKEEPKKEEAPQVTIDLSGFELRAVQLPVSAGSIKLIGFNDRNELLYEREGSIRILDLSERAPTEKTGPSVMTLACSPDGKKLLGFSRQMGKLTIADTTAGATGKPVDMKPMLVEIHPRHEWEQIFADVWRFYRDGFYDADMHGVDWKAIRSKYEAMLPAVVTREDLNYLIGEMIAELNVGHAYIVDGGEVEQASSQTVGMLGVDFAAATNADGTPAKAWKLAKFVGKDSLDSAALGPLAAQGLGVSEGDYLLAVNGEPVDPSRDPWAQFVGLAGRSVVLTVSKKPTMDGDSKDIVVTTLESESELRYHDWVESQRRRVEALSGGRIGYIYVPDTADKGQNELVRQFFGQRTKPALLIDERWNSGGHSPSRFIELLNRPIAHYWARRDVRGKADPSDGHAGPKAMLVNGEAGSGGDLFPWLFKHQKLGPVIGTRTWGGLVGYSEVSTLIDGGSVTVPSIAFYKSDGTWGVEGHGVDPDIEVIDDPAKMKDGRDPQLEKAVEVLLKELETKAYRAVPKPKGPIRSGMGIPDKDK